MFESTALPLQPENSNTQQQEIKQPINTTIMQQLLQRVSEPSYTPRMNIKIDWNKVAEVFKSPKATPAFYKTALGLLGSLLNMATEQEKNALTGRNYDLRGLELGLTATQRDMKPLIDYYKVLGDVSNSIREQFQLASDPVTKAKLLEQMFNVTSTMRALNEYILTSMGIPLPKQQTGQQVQSPTAQRQKPMTMTLQPTAIPEDQIIRWSLGLP